MSRELILPTFTKESKRFHLLNHLKQIKIMRKVTALLAFFGLFAFMSCDKSSYTEDFQMTKTTTSGNNGGFGITPGPGTTRDSVRTSVYWETHLLDAFM